MRGDGGFGEAAVDTGDDVGDGVGEVGVRGGDCWSWRGGWWGGLSGLVRVSGRRHGCVSSVLHP